MLCKDKKETGDFMTKTAMLTISACFFMITAALFMFFMIYKLYAQKNKKKKFVDFIIKIITLFILSAGFSLSAAFLLIYCLGGLDNAKIY